MTTSERWLDVVVPHSTWSWVAMNLVHTLNSTCFFIFSSLYSLLDICVPSVNQNKKQKKPMTTDIIFWMGSNAKSSSTKPMIHLISFLLLLDPLLCNRGRKTRDNRLFAQNEWRFPAMTTAIFILDGFQISHSCLGTFGPFIEKWLLPNNGNRAEQILGGLSRSTHTLIHVWQVRTWVDPNYRKITN